MTGMIWNVTRNHSVKTKLILVVWGILVEQFYLANFRITLAMFLPLFHQAVV